MQRQSLGGELHRHLLALCLELQLLPEQLEERGDLLLRQGLGEGRERQQNGWSEAALTFL